MEITLEKPRGYFDWLRMYILYLSAFPPSERKPFGIIRSMYNGGRTDVWRILRDGKFAGFASTVNGRDLILLDYLAIAKVQRGRGVGSGAMSALMARYSGLGLFVEIETTKKDSHDRMIREKCRRFYENAGMIDLGVSARIFGVEMDLLGVGCALTFGEYQNFYRDYYSPRAAQHLEPLFEE